MRIALIAGSYQPDRCGVAHYTARLRDALSARGGDSLVLTDRTVGQGNAPSVRSVVDGWRMRDLPSLVAAVRASGVDLLHVQHAAGTYGFRRAIFLLPPLLRAAGWHRPIVTTAHEYGWWEWTLPGVLNRAAEWAKRWGQARGWWDREDGFLLTGSDAVVTTHHDAEGVIRRRLPMLDGRVHRIPIGANVEPSHMDRDQARAGLRQRFGWPADARVIAFFGFLHPVKGLETLLEAFQHVTAAHAAARLLLVGGAESLALRGDAAVRYEHELRERVRGLGLRGLVGFTGWLPADAASRHLAGADLGVLPFNHGVTLKSGSLLTLLAHGVPVVASTPQGETLADQAGVHAVPPRNPDRLAAAIEEMLADPGALERQGGQGRAFAQQFAWPEIAARHVDLYRSLVGVSR